jgi:hypothetical protein
MSSQSPTTLVLLPLAKATTVEVSITKIENPSEQPIGIRVTVVACPGSKSRNYDLGMAVAYPATQAGVFDLPLSKDAVLNLATCDGKAEVRMTLTPVREGEPLSNGTVVRTALQAR